MSAEDESPYDGERIHFVLEFEGKKLAEFKIPFSQKEFDLSKGSSGRVY